MTRTRFGLAAVAAGAVVFAAAPAGGQLPVPLGPKGSVDPKMPHFLACAKACDDCARACDLSAAHSAKLLADGNKEHLATLRACQDAAAICTAAARVVAKDGPMSDVISAACAEACKRCAGLLDKHAADPILKQCADECGKCEKACRDHLAQAKPAPPK